MPTNPRSNRKANSSKDDGFEIYNMLAETVGGLPTLRLKDNVIQAIVIVGSTALVSIVSAIFGGALMAVIFGILTLVVSTLLSGLVLMVMGWIRTAKKMK